MQTQMINRYWITGIVATVFNLALFQADLNEPPASFLVGLMVGITSATVAEWFKTVAEWWDWKNH